MRSLLPLLCACGPAPLECKQPIAAGELVITEVMAKPAWVEIYNASPHAIDVDGLSIAHGATLHALGAATIAPGQYFVAGAAASYVDAALDLGDVSGKLALACGTRLVDQASFGPFTPGHARELSAARPPDANANDDPASWCDASQAEIVAGSFGTPGHGNDCVPIASGTCSGRPIVAPHAGDLVLTEVMPSPIQVPDALGEWIEAIALADVDLNGVGIARDGHAPQIMDAADCIHVAAGERFVLARSRDGNGGLPAVAGTFGFALVVPGDVELVAGGAVIDQITWPRATAGAALQLDPRFTDPQSNDDPASFCDATTPYGAGDLGTPGAPNPPCPAIPPDGMCLDGVAPRAIAKPGALAITEVMANPRVEPAQEWFEIENIGAAAFDLNELGLDRAGDTRAPDVIRAAACKSLPPGGFALFARSADPASNGGLPPVDATFGFVLVNTGGDVRVLDGERVLDAVTWASSIDGRSAQLVPVACPGVTAYGDGSNLGTPRAENRCE